MNCKTMNPASFPCCISQHQCRLSIVGIFFKHCIASGQVYSFSLELELMYVIMCKYLYLNVQTKCEQDGSSKHFYEICTWVVKHE